MIFSGQKKDNESKKGFTLVEVMIAIGLFTVIMTIGIGAVLGVNSTQRKTQSMRAIIDNLSFLMEDMARSMRLGNYFYCKEGIGDLTIADVASGQQQLTNDGQNCYSISFEPYWDPTTSPDNQVVYHIAEDQNGIGTIFKKEYDMGWSDDMLVVTPSEIDIDVDRSGFYVTGSTFGDNIQPRIKIVLVGTVHIAGATTEFNLQTTVSQRLLDVGAFN